MRASRISLDRKQDIVTISVKRRASCTSRASCAVRICSGSRACKICVGILIKTSYGRYLFAVASLCVISNSFLVGGAAAPLLVDARIRRAGHGVSRQSGKGMRRLNPERCCRVSIGKPICGYPFCAPPLLNPFVHCVRADGFVVARGIDVDRDQHILMPKNLREREIVALIVFEPCQGSDVSK